MAQGLGAVYNAVPLAVLLYRRSAHRCVHRSASRLISTRSMQRRLEWLAGSGGSRSSPKRRCGTTRWLDDRLIARPTISSAPRRPPAEHDAKAGLAGWVHTNLDNLESPGFGIANGRGDFRGEITKLPAMWRPMHGRSRQALVQAAGGVFNLKAQGEERGYRPVRRNGR